MTSRRQALSFTFVTMILTVWSVCWAVAAEHHIHARYHRRLPRPAPPTPPDGGTGSSPPRTPGPKAEHLGEPEVAPDAPDRKHHADEMGEAQKWEGHGEPGARAGRHPHAHAERRGGPPQDVLDRVGPARSEQAPSLGHQSKSSDSRAKTAALPNRPNILVLLLNDQDDFTPFWEAMPRTAAMVQNGLRFRRAFAPTPVCAPGRCTFLTGRLAHNTGVFTLSGPHGPAAFGGQASTEFSVGLSQLGYINGYFGKTWGNENPNPGWERWCAVGGNNMYTGYGYRVTDYRAGGKVGRYTSDQYITDFLAEKAVAFVERGIRAGQPFFLCLAPTAPHLPLPPAPHDVEFAKRRWRHRLPIRPNFNEPDVSDKSSWLRETAFVRSECVP